ncbi:MAG: PAS domain S-box protein, partial [Ignavibacteriales bacterium]|nr:PAS domain S-box protein [Ignavibacteriales bacterium]
MTSPSGSEQSERRYRQLVDLSPDAIAIHCQGKLVFINQAGAELLGASSPEELIGKPIIDIVHPDYRASVIERIRTITTDGKKAPRLEEKFIRLDGKVIDVDEMAMPITYLGMPAVQVVVRDITERKRAEETLRESEERYRKLVETAPEVIYSLAEDGTITTLNPAFESITGWSCSEWLGKQFIPLVHPDDVPLAIETFKKALNEEKLPPYELRILSKSGEYIVGEFTSTSLINKGKVVGEFGIARNITERKHAQEMLATSEESYRGLFNSLDDAVYVQDAEGKFLDLNEGAVKMYGYPREYFSGRTPEFLSAPGKNDLKATMEAIQRAFAGEPQRFEWWGIRKNGEIFPKDVQLTKGSYFGKDVVIAIARDITERKSTEGALTESEKRYRILFEGANDAIFIMSEDRFIECNDMTLRIFGCEKKEDIIGHNPWNYSPLQQPDGSDSREKALKVIHAALDGFPQRFYWKHNRKDKSLFDAEVSLNRIELGDKIFLQALVRDITERFQAEKALRESEERYRSLFDRMMDGVYRSTHDGRFVDVNDAMVKMFGFSSKEEMLKVDIKKELYFAHSDRDSLFLDTGREKIEVFRMRRKDGSEIWVEDHGHYVHDEQGNIIFHEGILRNITERMRNEVLQNAIYQISQSTDKAFTLDDLYKSVHQIIGTVMPANNFYISLYDKEKDLIRFPYFIDEVDI